MIPSTEYLITSLVVVLLPGTGVIYTLAIGIGRGWLASVAAAFGCTLGIVPAALASVIGLSAILHTSALLYQGMKLLGVLYLFYMAWSMLRDDSLLDVKPSAERNSLWRIAINGALLNVLNPKLSLFFLAFLPQFVSSGSRDTTLELVGLASIFMSLTFVVFVGYGACAALARDHVISRPRVMSWIKRSLAASFGVLGLKLALSERI